MKRYALVNEDGLFMEDVLLEYIPSDPQYVETECPGGFIRPKWTGTEWVEGHTT
jgi:hypothetical protein